MVVLRKGEFPKQNALHNYLHFMKKQVKGSEGGTGRQLKP